MGRSCSSTSRAYRDQNGQGWADIIDLLMIYPEARRRVVEILGDIEAASALRLSGYICEPSGKRESHHLRSASVPAFAASMNAWRASHRGAV